MSSLHQFHLHLCDYARSNAAAHLGTRYISERARLLDLGLRQYLLGEAGDDAADAIESRPDGLLLNDEELFELENLYRELSGVCGFDWSPCPELHGRSILCVREIRDHLNPTEADAWSRASETFSADLIQPRLTVEDGIQVISDWTGAIQRYLIAMNLLQFLPAPYGAFPTPTCPGVQPTNNTHQPELEGEKHPPIEPLFHGHARPRKAGQSKTSDKSQSPPEVARDLGVSPDKVRHWIETNELAAVNVAMRTDGRPRYRISQDDLRRFLSARSPLPAPLPAQRRQRKFPDVIKFF